MEIRQAVKAVLPPILTQLLRKIRFMIVPPDFGLTFAPEGWRAAVQANANFESDQYLAFQQDQWLELWAPFFRSLMTGGVAAERLDAPLSDRIENHSTWMTFAYVLALTAIRKPSLRILDYGAGLGHCCWIAKALLPGIALEYHCKELPGLARLGRQFTPEAVWHTDDSCLDEQYDLVMFGSVLQYVEDWPALLHRASSAARPYLYINQTPVVEHVPSYVAIQNLEGHGVLHQQINRRELLEAFAKAELELVREFLENEHCAINRAPEHPSYFGCLLQSNREAV